MDSRDQNIAADFSDFGRDMFIAGLVGSHSGNMSVRRNGRVIVTRRGARLGRLNPDDLVAFGLSDKKIPKHASSESSVHVAVYEKTSSHAVVHAHPPHAVAISLVDNRPEFVPKTLEASHYLPSVPVIDAPAGAAVETVSHEIGELLAEHKIVIARGHGTYSTGVSLEIAYQWTSVLEEACKVALALRWNGR